MEPAALSLDNVTVSPGGTAILRDFSLRVAPGEKAVVTGPSGAGKTTVLRCLAGLVIPAAGAVSVDGVRMDRHTVWELRGRLAYVPQAPDLGTDTVFSWLQRPFAYRSNRGLDGDPESLIKLLRHFRLDGTVLEKMAGELSGGEKQRVALVSAISLRRTIFLLDEPVSALDEANAGIVADYFQSRKDCTVLAAAHAAGGFPFAHRVVALPERAGEEMPA